MWSALRGQHGGHAQETGVKLGAVFPGVGQGPQVKLVDADPRHLAPFPLEKGFDGADGEAAGKDAVYVASQFVLRTLTPEERRLMLHMAQDPLRRLTGRGA